MAYETPLPTTFKARYAAFKNVSDERVAVFLSDAEGAVSTGWNEADYPRGLMAYAAHLLTLDGEPGRADATASGGSATNADRIVKKFTVGDVTEEYDTSRETASGATTATGLDDTDYGRIYLDLARRNIVTVIAL